MVKDLGLQGEGLGTRGALRSSQTAGRCDCSKMAWAARSRAPMQALCRTWSQRVKNLSFVISQDYVSKITLTIYDLSLTIFKSFLLDILLKFSFMIYHLSIFIHSFMLLGFGG